MNFEKPQGIKEEVTKQDIESNDFWERLGVDSEKVTPVQIDLAYEELSKKYQPEEGPVTQEMCLLDEAYNALRTPRYSKNSTQPGEKSDEYINRRGADMAQELKKLTDAHAQTLENNNITKT